ncbi:MAG: dTDP-4-dehydrorhamnose 3,5-epimerase family protein [Synechococcaceae cyanobacterium]|nr:dTDP-4-dehydrorhamnose 3,5-epimerase family protein [Synechococcaceae cyanobacterium]
MLQVPIKGLQLRPLITHQDERGSLYETYSDAWTFDAIPMVHTYVVTIRPGQTKGWALHQQQTDRYCFLNGATKLVLFDARADSVTQGNLYVQVFSEINRHLVSVPPGIWHALENIGSSESQLFNFPSAAYNYSSPDKLILPLANSTIPYQNFRCISDCHP